MFEFNGWQFSAAIPSVFACSIIFCVSVYLSVRTWSKNGKKKKVVALELVRTLSVLFLLITLLNPEKIEEINLDEKEKSEFLHSIDAVKKLWEAASKIDPDLNK